MVLNFEFLDEILGVTIEIKLSFISIVTMVLIEQYFPVVLFIILYKVVLTFTFVDKILKCDHSNESY